MELLVSIYLVHNQVIEYDANLDTKPILVVYAVFGIVVGNDPLQEIGHLLNYLQMYLNFSQLYIHYIHLFSKF